jgi:hypothetical protein
MSTGAIIGIIIAVIVVAAVVVVASAQLRRARLRRQFGPEYDRLAGEIGPRKADAELTARRRRVEALDIHPLSGEQQAKYSGEWAVIQERFVDAPGEAMAASDALIWAVMRDRGYPASDRTASTEALSVHHARAFEDYRQTQGLSPGSATTEQLRETLIRHRVLFEDLTGLREAQPGRHRAGQVDDTAVGDGQVVAGSGRVAPDSGRVAGDSGLAAENRDPAARDLAVESADRPADTPR